MEFLRTHKNICSIVAAVMTFVLIVYSYGSFRSYAATVSTLPADIDINVDFDSDNINMTYSGNTYTFNRHAFYMDLFPSDLPVYSDMDEAYSALGESGIFHYVNGSSFDMICHLISGSSGWSSSEAFAYASFYSGSNTWYLEYDTGHGLAPVSYWLSPSNNLVFIVIANYVSSYDNFTYVQSYDSATGYMSVCDAAGKAIASSSSGYHRNHTVYVYDLNTRSLSTSWYRSGGYNHKYDFSISYNSSSKIYTLPYKFPADLVCFFANYEISGFYDLDSDKIVSPDYYFNFQYIFYKAGYGYIFIDCAKRIKQVGFPSGVTNPRFYFEEKCNCIVYSSVDGISWSHVSTLADMYAEWFEVSCNYAFTDYTLIYTNDSSFGDPLVTPEWGDFSDVIDKLPDITDVYDNLLSHKTDKKGSSLSGLNKFMYQLISGITSNIGLNGVYDSITSAIMGDSYTYTLSEYMLTKLNTDLSVGLVYDYAEIDGEAWEVPRVTLYGYIVHIDSVLNDLLSDFNDLISISDSRLKSIYQNITLTNQYLKRISGNFDSLSIPAAAPDYSGDFDKLSAALDKLHNDLIYEEGVTKLPNVPQYLVYVYGVTKDIRTRLDTVISKLPGSVEVDTDSVVTAVDEMSTAITDKLDSVIAKIPTSSGGGSFDDSNMVGSIAALKSDISGNFETLIKLLKNDIDDVEGIQDLTSFITSYVVSMGNAAYFTTLLDFADSVKNNVVLINETIVSMVTDSGIYAPIFTLGAGFAVFSGLIRKERMN